MLLNFSWLIPQQLAGSGQPGGSHFGFPSPGALAQDLEQLSSNGVRALVSLTEEPLDRDAVAEAGIAYIHVPVPDMTAPSTADIDRFMEFVKASHVDMRPVAVHCRAGLGRTGTMLACYLVSQGHEPSEALQEVRRLRPGSVETAVQESVVQAYGERQKANSSEPA